MSLHLNNESDRCECHDCVHIRVGMGPASIGYTPKPDAFQKPPTKEEVKRDYHNCDCEFCGHPDTIHVPAKPQPSPEKCDCDHMNINHNDFKRAQLYCVCSCHKPKDAVEEKIKDIVERMATTPIGWSGVLKMGLRDLVRLARETK